MSFPVAPLNGDVYTNALGTQYEYDSTDDKWVIVNGSGAVSDVAYAASWDGDTTHVPSKNAVYDYTVKQHNRELAPNFVNPEQGYASGTANVYFSANSIRFGATSLTNTNYLWLTFCIPDDYVSGENMTFELIWTINVASIKTVDYAFDYYYSRAGVQYVNIETDTGTSAGNNVFATISTTITGTNVLAGDYLMIRVGIEDQSTGAAKTHGFKLTVPVNTRT